MTRLISEQHPLFFLKIFFFLPILFFATHIHAATVTVTIDSDWTDLTVAADDDVVVRGGATLTINVNNAVCESLQLGVDIEVGTGTISFNAGSQLTVTSTISIGAPTFPDRQGTIIMTAGGTLLCNSIMFNTSGTGTNNTITQGVGSTITVTSIVTINQPTQDGNTHSWNVNEGTATVNGQIIFVGLDTGTRTGQIEITTGTLNANGGMTFVVVTIGVSKKIQMTGNGTLNIGGSGVLFSDGGNLNATAGTVNYNAAGAQTVAGFLYINLIFSGSGAKSFESGCVINTSLSMQGTATASGLAPTYAAAATLEYAGTTTQTASSVEFANTNGPFNLTINNSNGVNLHAGRSLLGTLSLTSGILVTTATNLLTLGDGAMATGASDASFVSGPLAKLGDDAFTFPVGKSGRYAPIGISTPTLPVASNTFRAEYFIGEPTDRMDVSGGINHISELEYWQLDRTSGSSSVSVTLSWRSSSAVTSPADLVVARYDGTSTSWENEGNASTTGDASSGTITSDPIDTFSPCTLGSTAGGGANPLPIELNYFTAKKKEQAILLEWETTLEENNAFFQIERSIDGKQFSTIGKIAGAGHSDIPQSYQLLDEKPLQGINYYRLKQVDFDGAFEYHPIVSIEIAPAKDIAVLAFPNPTTDKVNLFIPGNLEGTADIKLFNAFGQLVKQKAKGLKEGNNTEVLEVNDLPKGQYTITIEIPGQRVMQIPLVIQR